MAARSEYKGVETATAVALAVLAVDSFHKFLPSVADIRKADPGDNDIRADVHAGELLAGITTVTVSYLASSVVGNPLPLVIGGMAFLSMVATYEWLLRADRPFEQ